jgi:feruloyl esterase
VQVSPSAIQKLIDFEYRAVHEMTTRAKAIIMKFYGSGPQHSYWNGCSGGGKQGLKEVQRYPADYDGIVTGAPTNYKTHMHAWQMNLSHSALSDKASYIPPSKYGLINSAVLAACDALDGIRDGILNDPRKCHFDPGVLLCRGPESANCLTAPQAEMARKMYAPVMDRQTGKVIYPGLEPGTELEWGGLIGGPQPFGLAHDLFRYLVHKDGNWDWHSFDLERDTASADAEYKDTMNALDADLRAFAARGGKLILWHGWSDPLVPPQNTIDYYRSVIGGASSKSGEFVRLFLAPGVQHCGGGPGPNQFQMVAALERWVEGGIAPDQMLAAHVTENRVDMTRPLCAYPQVAQWNGVGSTNDAGSFVCKAPDSVGLDRLTPVK